MTESRSGWSPDGVYHAVTEKPISIPLMQWTVVQATVKAACGARCLPHPTAWPQLASASRRCPRCVEILEKSSAPEVAHTPDAGATDRGAALGEQLEDLLNFVWACEKDWDLDDRIDGSIRYGR